MLFISLAVYLFGGQFLKSLFVGPFRVIAKGPYQLNNPKQDGIGSSSGGDPEDQSSKFLDLNL